MHTRTSFEKTSELLRVALYNGMAESERVGQGAPVSSFTSEDFKRLMDALNVPRYGHSVYTGPDRAPVRFEPCAYTYLPPAYVRGMSAVIHDAYLEPDDTIALLDQTVTAVSRPILDPETGYTLNGRRMRRVSARYIILSQLYAQGETQRSTAQMRGDDEAEEAMATYRLASREWMPDTKSKVKALAAMGAVGVGLRLLKTR